jgi:hypothetical protein
MNRIICAARRYDTGLVAIGVSDGDNFMVRHFMTNFLNQSFRRFERGFIDYNGTFQNAKHALAIAFAAGQITSARFALGEHLTTKDIY